MGVLNVVGLGYIGLPTAMMFAANGIEVVGTDYNAELVEKLNRGELTFEEDGLEELFNKVKKKGIRFTTEYIKTDRYIITVPTPYIKDSKKIDATYVVNAVKTVLDNCEKGTIIVIESTISPGTIDKFIKPIIQSKGFMLGKDIHIAHAPERIIPGRMVHELENNSRTIGADEREIGEEIKAWYESFCRAEIVVTNIKTAEMSKVVENTFRDINIAFANELAKMCHKEGMDVYELIRIANKHPRVNILQPGPGVGGHCISVDPWFLVGDYPDIVNVVLGAREVNDAMPQYVFDRIHEIMRENNIKDFSQVGLYGLTYKENIDDMRESPTLQLLQIMNKYNITNIKLYDPWVKDSKFNNQYHDIETFLNDTKIIIVLVGHSEIKEKQELLKNKIVYDTRNIISHGRKIYRL
ncbi:nucleotide sugar dehydrogenase [Clostridium intestinale]|uniref:UDP-N-acetyl-D-mannosaminuronic acid dehydrogenase n=1 Tax=Clostridium intestinale DSM 6191 TaxID=1121320 RepID=A0A1M6DLX7_9CLOT|nr:nucleotide sugar dehydrogenase [Clostridium intestinale]SHI74069.1 UDP-N-acetyl-D-mannosaminuronic acid dehydrogenase [Clostridium intestinale DSM 6191]